MHNEAFALKISSAIDQQQYDKAADQVEALRPIDIADILALINPSSAWQLLERLPNRSTIFSYLDADAQVAMALKLPREQMAKLVGEMPADERTDLYKRLNQQQRDALLPALAQAQREYIRRLAAYAERTAGALITSISDASGVLIYLFIASRFLAIG